LFRGTVKDVKQIFREEEKEFYDFSKSPELIRLEEEKSEFLKRKGLGGGRETKEEISTWREIQDGFIERAKNEGSKMYKQENVKKSKDRKNKFFEDIDLMEGDVIDIGGGWGLYREWWKGNDEYIYVVHDPGVERFLVEPHDSIKKYYGDVLDTQMTFVEGFGETLPYRDGIFDVCLIASTIKHCADPKKVLKESYRVLKSGGRLLVIDSFESSDEDESTAIKLQVLINHLKEEGLVTTASVLWRKFIYAIKDVDEHMHSFTKEYMKNLLKESGFSISKESGLGERRLGIEAKKV